MQITLGPESVMLLTHMLNIFASAAILHWAGPLSERDVWLGMYMAALGILFIPIHYITRALLILFGAHGDDWRGLHNWLLGNNLERLPTVLAAFVVLHTIGTLEWSGIPYPRYLEGHYDYRYCFAVYEAWLVRSALSYIVGCVRFEKDSISIKIFRTSWHKALIPCELDVLAMTAIVESYLAWDYDILPFRMERPTYEHICPLHQVEFLSSSYRVVWLFILFRCITMFWSLLVQSRSTGQRLEQVRRHERAIFDQERRHRSAICAQERRHILERATVIDQIRLQERAMFDHERLELAQREAWVQGEEFRLIRQPTTIWEVD